MIIVMQGDASPQQIERVMERIQDLGYKPHPIRGVEHTVIGAIGDERGKSALESLVSYEGVESVIPILKPFKLASQEMHREPTVIEVNGVQIGGGGFALIAGPCSVESETQIIETARAVKKSGANMLRGGAFKPRTSPYSFQGLEQEGLKLLAQARQETGLPVVTEILSPENVDLVAEYADVMQVGARNMQNFSLLKKLGKVNRPVLLKRGMMCTIKEALMSAEYILSSGNPSGANGAFAASRIPHVVGCRPDEAVVSSPGHRGSHSWNRSEVADFAYVQSSHCRGSRWRDGGGAPSP